MGTIKADLHNHLLIGFQPTWKRLQGYEGGNLAELMFESATAKDIGLVAITSEEKEIPKGSVHDRFGCLVNEARTLRAGFEHDKVGENVLIISRDDKKLIIFNGQAVGVRYRGDRYDHLVIGSNQVPNGMNFSETMKYCNDHGLLHGAEHPFSTSHFGIGKALLTAYLENYDFVETGNAQLRWSKNLSWVPKIGGANRGANEEAEEFAREHNKPGIATSDAHQPQDTGLGYISFYEGLLDLSSADKPLKSLGEIVRTGDFSTHLTYPSRLNWLKWATTFQYGIRKPIPDN